MDASQAFGSVASAYARYRPTYPASLFTSILDHNPSLGVENRRQVAVDVAAGSLQASLPLASLFERVVALDSCSAQLEQARAVLARAQATAEASEAATAHHRHRRIELRQADAHSTGLDDASADLITVAQALHWFDVPTFAEEAARVLRPHGTLAAWSYGLARVDAVAGGARRSGGGGDDDDDDDDDDEPVAAAAAAAATAPPPPPPSSSVVAAAAEAADAAVRRLYDTLQTFWDERRAHVDDAYARLAPLLLGEEAEGGGGGPFAKVFTRKMEMRAWKGLDEVVGYVESWSALGRLREARRQGQERKEQKEQEEEEDPVVAFRRELLAAVGGAEDASLELVTPIVLVLATEPRRRSPAEGGA
jgi:SAM-dependent methyltransferase